MVSRVLPVSLPSSSLLSYLNFDSNDFNRRIFGNSLDLQELSLNESLRGSTIRIRLDGTIIPDLVLFVRLLPLSTLIR